MVNVADYVSHASNDEELMEVLLGLANANEESERDANNHDDEEQAAGTFHNDFEWDEHTHTNEEIDNDTDADESFEDIFFALAKQDKETTRSAINLIAHGVTATKYMEETTQIM